jgi:hypothetical protein
VQISRREFLASAAVLVKAKHKPDEAWKEYPTRTVADVVGLGKERVELDRFGGRADRKIGEPPGFFRPAQRSGRWWLADPEGNAFLKVGVCSTAPAKGNVDLDKWAGDTVRLLRANGFNGIGGWSRVEAFRAEGRRLVYTPSWNFAAEFGRAKKLTFQQPGHMGYLGDLIPVFHPEFESFCDEYAKRLAAAKDDSWLLGHYSDNELPAYADMLDRALKHEATRETAQAWVREHGENREAFVEDVYDRYLRVTTGAIRKHDPNHLCLGPRLHGGALKHAGILRAAGRHLDAVAMNVYNRWTPEPELFDAWRTYLKKPVIVTEFYAKGADSGFANTTGAGWLVPTQRDRALFYQNFLLAMLESKLCVGWDWFKYMDNDPNDTTTDPSNRDSNKGIVKVDYEPYRELLEGMRELNGRVYQIAESFR